MALNHHAGIGGTDPPGTDDADGFAMEQLISSISCSVRMSVSSQISIRQSAAVNTSNQCSPGRLLVTMTRRAPPGLTVRMDAGFMMMACATVGENIHMPGRLPLPKSCDSLCVEWTYSALPPEKRKWEIVGLA